MNRCTHNPIVPFIHLYSFKNNTNPTFVLVHQISKYGLFQWIGWTFFAIVNIYIAILTNELTSEIVFINILSAFLGLAISHIYRILILRFKWIALPTEKLVVVLAIALSIISVVYNIFYFLVLFIVQKENFMHLTPSAAFGSFVAVFFLFSIWSIIYFAWTYVENNRKMLIERLQLEANMKDLELKTIRANLQPHFIFNSLNSIRALIDENPVLARQAITNISNILRKTITQQDATDSLENELQLVDDYLALEKIRFEERLHYIKQIDPSTLGIQIPTMMLQTLVENAIKHGVSMLEKGGQISIRTELVNEALHIHISNNGNLTMSLPHAKGLGFGVNATKQRLKLIYKGAASFRIFQKDDLVNVEIIIQKI